MNVVLAVTIGCLFAAGTYLLLRRSMIQMLFGIVLLGNATNLLVFTCARIMRGHSPIMTASEKELAAPYPDPLGQALILTAIVISFAVLAFAMILVRRGFEFFKTDDPDVLTEVYTPSQVTSPQPEYPGGREE